MKIENVNINKIKANLTQIPNYNGYYCNENGKIYTIKKGKLKEIKGSPDKDGYVKITLIDNQNNNKYLRLHRIIIMTFNGESNLQVNHIDNNKKNNELINLEYVNSRENQSHRRKNEGHSVGVCWAKKEKKWRAYISNNKKWEHLGFFEDKEEAKNAYIKRLKELNLTNKYAL